MSIWSGKDGLESDTEEKRRPKKNEAEGYDSIPITPFHLVRHWVRWDVRSLGLSELCSCHTGLCEVSIPGSLFQSKVPGIPLLPVRVMPKSP